MKADNENSINIIKARVLADIRNRQAKKSENDKENAKTKAAELSQAAVGSMTDSQLEESMKLFTR